MSNFIKGFDCSHNNSVQWDKLHPDLKFVFIKSSQGAGFHDPLFQTNWKTARDKGLLHGPYHFLTAVDSAEAQAANFLNRGVDWSLPNVLPPVLDVEDQVPAALNAGITKDRDAFIQLVTDWINIVERQTKRKVIIYSYKNFFIEYLKSHAWVNNPLWLASYQPNTPGLPAGYNNFQFWQYTQYGSTSSLQFTYDPKVAATNGWEMDLDYFNGTIDQLHAL